MKYHITDPTYPHPSKRWCNLTPLERARLYMARAKWRAEHLSAKHEAFALRVKRLREALGLTQVQFARQMGVFLRTICRWEAGEGHTPSLPNLHRLEELEALNKAVLDQGRKGDFR